MKIKNLFRLLFFSVMTLSLAACNNDDKEKDFNPIRALDVDDPIVNLILSPTNTRTLTLAGGDGNYSITCIPQDILQAEMTNKQTLVLKPLEVGQAVVIIKDHSNNSYTLTVNISNHKETYPIVHLDVFIEGENLTEKEKKEIWAKALLTIPVHKNGAYEFVYTNKTEPKGEATLYTGAGGTIKTTFEYSKTELNGNSFPTYTVIIDNVKRKFVLHRYIPVSRALEPIIYCLREDITESIKQEYPNAEAVYTQQVIQRKN